MSPERPPGHLDLLSTGGGEGGADHRDDRADALARSRHSRIEPPRPPAGETRHADELCAAVCQSFLRDLSPAFLLMGAKTRDRCRTLGAFTFTLFDFARQRGTEGERLSQINQWEFSLEAALGGHATGQPIFDRMAAVHRERPWPLEALDALIAEARRRVSAPRPRSAQDAVARAERLARALLHALGGAAPNARATRLAAMVLRAAVLRDLAEETRQRRSPLPVDEFPESLGEQDDSARALEAARGELSALAQAGADHVAGLDEVASLELRRALHFGLGAVGRWSRETTRIDLREDAPQLGLGARLALLLRARFAGSGR